MPREARPINLSSSAQAWFEDKDANGWEMPAAAAWKRWPIIRYIRATYHAMKVRRHNRAVRAIGMIPSGYDGWVVYGIATGRERNIEA